MRGNLRVRGHPAHLPAFRGYSADTEQAIAHAPYGPPAIYISIGKSVNRSECLSINREELHQLGLTYQWSHIGEQVTRKPFAGRS